MPTNKLTIVPVTLDPLHDTTSIQSPPQPSGPRCVIKTATVENAFFNGIDERIIQIIMKELNSQ